MRLMVPSTAAGLFIFCQPFKKTGIPIKNNNALDRVSNGWIVNKFQCRPCIALFIFFLIRPLPPFPPTLKNLWTDFLFTKEVTLSRLLKHNWNSSVCIHRLSSSPKSMKYNYDHRAVGSTPKMIRPLNLGFQAINNLWIKKATPQEKILKI